MELYFLVVLIFQNFVSGNCCSTCLPSQNFWSFWLNGTSVDESCSNGTSYIGVGFMFVNLEVVDVP